MGSKNSKLSEDESSEGNHKQYMEMEKKKYGEIDPFFHEFDYNKNGSLSENEFKEAIKNFIKIHPEKEKNLNELITNLDIGLNNPIGLEDFRKIMEIYLSDDINLDSLVYVFKTMDKNMQNQIGAKEIQHVFSKLGLNLSDEEARELVLEADTDGDETMDFEEFLKIMIAK